MTVQKHAQDLTEEGARALLRFMADNLKEESIRFIIGPWMEDMSFQGTEGDFELNSFYSKTGRPVTRTFSGDEVELEDVEIEED